MDGFTDTELGLKIRRGNEEAFRQIYDRYAIQRLYNARRYVESTELAEDAVQETFIKLWNKRHSLDETRSMCGYRFTILRKHLINMLRDQKKGIISMIEVHRTLVPSSNSTEEEIVYREYHEILQRGMEELSERKREIFELRSIKGYSNSEVADLLNINIRTVKTHYYLSSRFIRGYLRDHADIILILLSVTGLALFF